MNDRKENLLQALRAFARQRPGLEFGNYGELKAYRAELRSITKDLQHAQELLTAVALRDSITADAIVTASKRAYSGRLTITEPKPGRFALDYCTGQYFPTEYRPAVCAALSAALWEYAREQTPAPEAWRVASWSSLSGRDYGEACSTREEAERELAEKGGQQYGHVQELVPFTDYMKGTPGDWMRWWGRKELGRSIAARWFN